MKRVGATTWIILFITQLLAAQAPGNFWKEVRPQQVFLPEKSVTVDQPSVYRTLSLDFEGMKNHLANAPAEGSTEARAGRLQVELPMPDGSTEVFKVWESSVMHPELAAQFPLIKTFAGMGITDAAHSVRFGFGPDGFHAFVLAENGGSIVTALATNQTQYYSCFPFSDFSWSGDNLLPTVLNADGMEPFISNENNGPERVGLDLRGGGEGALTKLRTLRFALVATGEYSQNHGGTTQSVLSSLVTATSTLNTVLERDHGVRLQLVVQTSQFVFLDPTTDPFATANVGSSLLVQNQSYLDNVLGFDKYDVGHIFTGGCTDVGGVVSGSTCNNGKARGVTCHSSSNVVAVALGTMAHEMGHQFSAGHTFNNCPGNESQLQSGSAYEPGSGSTILSYKGACSSNNISGPRGTYYHGGTIKEFFDFLKVAGNECGTLKTTANHSPNVKLPYVDGFYIPISTPFDLEAIASDEDGDALTYCWEQVNLGPSAQLGEPVSTAPSFRSFDPVSSSKRTFPRLSILLSNGAEIEEVLPTYTRNLKFRCTVRDNNVTEGAGGVTWQDVGFFATNTAGPFLVTSPNTAGTVWKAGQQVEVTWDVANTDNDIVKCFAVNIKLSVDGGLTYPYTLASQTANDGSETVSVPDVSTNTARIRVEGAGNIFFDVSNANFQIQAAEAPTFTVLSSPQWQSICLPGNVNIRLKTYPVSGFEAPIRFSVTDGLPTHVSHSFSKNDLQPGDSTTLFLNLENATSSEILNLTLRAIGGGDTIYRTLIVQLNATDFSDLVLTGPANGASGSGLLPAFEWVPSAYADGYDFQLSTSPTFEEGSIVESAVNLTATTYTPAAALVENQIYFWRIRSFNLSCEGYSLPSAFQTITVSCNQFNSSDTPLNISAIGTPTVESVITVLQPGLISDLNVSKLKGTHDALPHLEARLRSPAGTEVVLFSGICGNVAGFDLALDDEAVFNIACPPIGGLKYKPQNPLAVFKGQNTLGNWSMKIKVINTDGQGGTFEKWGIEFCAAFSPNHPLVVKNETLHVPANETRTITNGKLSAEDSDNNSSQLRFTIVRETQFGFVSKNGAALSTGGQFTMTDINEGKIAYTNTDPNTTTDFFTFIVEDGTGGWFGTPKFNIIIDPNDPVAVEEEDFSNSILLYPNPARSILNVAFQRPLPGEAMLFISDVTGRKVLSQKVALSQSQLQVSLDDFASGLYFLNIRTAGGVFSKKFLVKR